MRRGANPIYYNIPIDEPEGPLHEVISTFRLLQPLDITGEPSHLILIPPVEETKRVLQYIHSVTPNPNLVALHISSRKEENRWPVDSFIELGNELMKRHNVTPLILWAPGGSKNPMHPGDDEKAKEIADRMTLRPILYKTTSLKGLIAAISVCKLTICCDGGAMHIAAALKKPIVAIWGSTDRQRWAPWKTKHIILQKGMRADEVTVGEVLAAFKELWDDVR